MPVSNDEIRKALDHFENDEFVDAKEVLQQQIKGAIGQHLKNKLNLKNDPFAKPEGDK